MSDTTNGNTEYADTLSEAVNQVKGMSWENGMATLPVTVERENCYVKVIRKSPSPDHPEIILFKVVPKNEIEPKYDQLGNDILDAMDLYGDLQVQFVEWNGFETAVIGL